MTYDEGEGPVNDPEAAKAWAKAERAKPAHQAKPNDPRDKAIDADLDDPALQEKDE